MTSRLFPLLWLLSFAAALLPFPAYEAEGVMVAYVSVAAGLAFALLKAQLPVRLEPLHLLFLLPVTLFWNVAFWSVAFSEVQTISYIWFGFFSLLPLSLCCVLAARDKVRFFQVTGAGLGLIFAALCFWCLLQFFTMPDMLLFGRVHWPFADPNSLAGLLVMVFFAGLALMLAAPNRVLSNIGLTLSILTIAALFTTGSRGAMAGLIVALVVFAATNFLHFKRHKKCVGVLIAAAVILFGAMSFTGAEMAEPTGTRIGATFSGEAPVLWSRPAIWQSTLEIFGDHFWTGTGIGTFFLYYNQYRGADLNSAGRMAHSDPLQFAAEMGVFAPVLFYVILGLAGFLTWRAVQRLAGDDVRRIYVLAPFCGLGAMVIHAHITFHFYVLSILMLAGLGLGFWYYQVQQISGTAIGKIPALPLPSCNVQKIILIFPLLIFSYLFLMLQGGQIYANKAGHAMAEGDFAGFVRGVNKASRVSMGRNSAALLYAVNIPLGVLNSDAPLQEIAANYAQAMKFLDEAGRLNPMDAAVPHFNARVILAVRGRVPTQGHPEELLQQALRINPLYYQVRMDLADLYEKQGQPEKALGVMAEGVKWRDAAAAPRGFYERLAAMALVQGNRKLHESALSIIRSRMSKK